MHFECGMFHGFTQSHKVIFSDGLQGLVHIGIMGGAP